MVSRANDREARICSWLSTEALSGVWLAVWHGGAGVATGIGLDDQQRTGIVDRSQGLQGRHAHEPAQEHAAEQQPAAPPDHLQQLREREFVFRVARSGWRTVGGQGDHARIIEIIRPNSTYTFE